MNWEQKLAALNAITECSLKMRKPGDWYVSQAVELAEGGLLVSAYGNGSTPERAVLDHWRSVVDPANINKPIVFRANGRRRRVFWNDCLWVDCPLPYYAR